MTTKTIVASLLSGASFSVDFTAVISKPVVRTTAPAYMSAEAYFTSLAARRLPAGQTPVLLTVPSRRQREAAQREATDTVLDAR